MLWLLWPNGDPSEDWEVNWEPKLWGATEDLASWDSKTGDSGFLRTKTMEISNRVPNEFDTNLELLKIAYKF
jgi:hypothetical protein